jgi:hypothetical protein
MNKLGEVSFENRPSKFPSFVEDARRICSTKEFVFGLEDTRYLALYGWIAPITLSYRGLGKKASRIS